MDKERQKRKQNIRLIITETIMTLTVIVMVIILTFVAMGYKVNRDGEVSQNGLVQISTHPTGASIMIDGETIFPRTDASRSLSSGEHTIKLTRDGYDGWEKTITVKPGLLYKLDYPRLFKQERESEKMLEFKNGLEFISMAPDRNSILYADKNATVFYWLRVRGEEIESKTIDVAELFRFKSGEKLVGEIRSLEWSGEGDRVMIGYAGCSNHEAECKDYDINDQIVVNLAKSDNSINLTREFGLNFTKVAALSDSAERLAVLENGNLRVISTGSKEMSRVLISNIADFVNVGSEILFITGATEGTRTIGYYIEGEKMPITLETVGGDGVRLAISKYLEKRYLTIAVGPEVTIYRVEEILEGADIEDFEKVGKTVLSAAPEIVEVTNQGRLITARNERKMFVFDVEQEATLDFELESDFTGWLDGFMLTNVVDGKLVVRDFDGSNRRELVAAKTGFSAMVTGNNRYLYYIVECGSDGVEKSCLQRDKL